MEYYCHESAQHTCHESTQYAQTTKWLREVASPVSMLPGYAKWLRGASRYTMYRTSAFAELFGVPHEAKIHHLRKKRCSTELWSPLRGSGTYSVRRRWGFHNTSTPNNHCLFPCPIYIYIYIPLYCPTSSGWTPDYFDCFFDKDINLPFFPLTYMEPHRGVLEDCFLRLGGYVEVGQEATTSGGPEVKAQLQRLSCTQVASLQTCLLRR